MPESTIMIMEYPKFFTPNGDSFNDRWNIKCLKDNPLAKIRIFDRFGKLLLDFKPNQNDWDGTLNGQLLPTSDYWFVASYLNSNGIETQFRSHFSLRY
jgi:gliding motility-associated-like protein